MNKCFVNARKIHTYMVIPIVILGVIMVFSGLLLKFSIPLSFLHIDFYLVRQIHSFASVFFSIVFTISMITGSFMYYMHIKVKRISKRK